MMKRLSLLISVVVVCACGTSAVADAPLVFCDCLTSDWRGGWYIYHVDSASYPMMEFSVGTGDLDLSRYTYVMKPPGWQFELTDAKERHACGDFAYHGALSAGPCRSLTVGVARWWTDDPALAVESAQFAFVHPWPAEDVGWELRTRRPGPPPEWYEFDEFWDSPVGAGMGPVHGPCYLPCWSNEECGPDRYCWLTSCAAETGQCRLRPTACPFSVEPVCGCDGVTYSNACSAAAFGMNIMYPWHCEAGDMDGDGDRDAADMEAMFECMTGPDIDPSSTCMRADADNDYDADLADGWIFQIMYGGM